MPITYRLTREDYFSAQALHAARYKGRFRWFMGVILTLVILWQNRKALAQGEELMTVGFMLAFTFLLIWLVSLGVPRLRAWSMTRHVWKRQPTLHEEVTFEILPEGLRSRMARGEWLQRWSDFIELRENDLVLLLYLGPNLMAILPKRVLSEAELAEIRAGVASQKPQA